MHRELHERRSETTADVIDRSERTISSSTFPNVNTNCVVRNALLILLRLLLRRFSFFLVLCPTNSSSTASEISARYQYNHGIPRVAMPQRDGDSCREHEGWR